MTWRSLTFQLLAIVVFPLIILLLVITFASTTMHENAMRDLVGQRDERAARMASTAIKEQIEWRMNEIQGIADQVAYASPDRASEVLQNTAYLKDEFDAGLAILDQHGQIIALRGDAAIWQGEGNWLDEAIRSLKTDPALPVFAVGPIDQADFESPLMVVIAPVRDRQYFAAGAFFTSPLVADVFASLTSAEHETSIALITSGGKILYSQGHNLQSEGVIEHAGASEALAGRHGTTYVNVGDSEHVIAYSPVEPFGWALLIEEPWEHVVSPLLQTTLLAPLVMVPVLLLALLALFFGIRQIVQPLQALAVQASHLGWGDYQAIEKPAGGVSEIRQLQLELIHMAQKVQAAQRSLHSYIGAITSGQEEERRRLARELHDETIQSLIALKQQIQLAEMDYAGAPPSKALARLEADTDHTIENVRRMVSALRPIYLEDLGLVAALHMLVNEVETVSEIAMAFDRQGAERRLEPAVELALYRVVQEALNNVAHHSAATQAVVNLTFHETGIKITVVDNGKGFRVPNSPAEFAPGGHFGLLGMFERVELIGGKLQVQSRPGEGTQLVVELPEKN